MNFLLDVKMEKMLERLAIVVPVLLKTLSCK